MTYLWHGTKNSRRAVFFAEICGKMIVKFYISLLGRPDQRLRRLHCAPRTDDKWDDDDRDKNFSGCESAASGIFAEESKYERYQKI